MANMHGTIPRIDFAGIDPTAAAGPGGDSSRWAAVRAAVMDALCEHGGFEAVMDGLISPELTAAMMGPGGAAESFFSLPPGTKALYTNKEKLYLGYVASFIPGMPYESLSVMDPLSSDAVPSLAGLMWPGTGNPSFCETVQAYMEKVSALEAVVRRMVLESVGAAAEHAGEQGKTTSLRLRLSAYPAPGTAEGRVGLPAHRDTSLLSVLTQNGIDGIEVELGRGAGGGGGGEWARPEQSPVVGGKGGWARPTLSPGGFLVLAGDMLRVLTNGRVFSPLHRVVVAGERTRYSCILFSNPGDDVVVRAVDGAVDAEHPAVYKPFVYSEYLGFIFSKEQYKNPNKLETFAAVGIDG
ncbi:unnamed protein product [Urochloa decumbens]|uniref:Fe2OG dioxygenase domain-containing protein n=1 Tax=Urochloa decumbens TaxID=240449 RepID=A0ABC9AW42_9POAL